MRGGHVVNMSASLAAIASAHWTCHCERLSPVIASSFSLSLRAPFTCHCERSAAISLTTTNGRRALAADGRSPRRRDCHGLRPRNDSCHAPRSNHPSTLRADSPPAVAILLPRSCGPVSLSMRAPSTCHCERSAAISLTTTNGRRALAADGRSPRRRDCHGLRPRNDSCYAPQSSHPSTLRADSPPAVAVLLPRRCGPFSPVIASVARQSR